MNILRFSRMWPRWESLGFAISLAAAAVLIEARPAAAIVYCQYVDYPPSCVARAGVVLRPRPVARAAVHHHRHHSTPTNRGGPVDRAGRR
jgi:hypothetical protein